MGAGRLLQRAGLSRPPAVTRAVDGVDLIVRPAKWSAWSANPAAASPRWAASRPCSRRPAARSINGLRPADMTPARRARPA